MSPEQKKKAERIARLKEKQKNFKLVSIEEELGGKESVKD